MSVPTPAVATWRAGQWKVTVTAAGGRQWLYDVIGSGDRPSPGWFAGTPWAMYPGAGWREADGTAEPPEWTVPVYPKSTAAALDLDIDQPPAK